MIITESTQQNETIEFITIAGSSVEEITREARNRGLADQNYSITNSIGQHRFMVVGENDQSVLGGRPMIAATYQRRVNA